MGRIKFLISSEKATTRVTATGVPRDFSSSIKWVGANIKEEAIIPSQTGSESVILNTGDTVIG